MVNWKISQTIDLQDASTGMIGMPYMMAVVGNRSAHEWQISVMDGGEPADLTGAIAVGRFCRADGDTVEIVGEIDGNTARVMLAEECYAIAGRVIGMVDITLRDAQTFTIAAISFDVRSGATDQIIVPGQPIQNLDDLLAYIHEVQALIDQMEQYVAIRKYALIVDETTANEVSMLEIDQAILRSIQKRDFLILITTPTSPAAGNIRFNATASKSSTVAYNTLNGAISMSNSPSVTYMEICDNGGLWHNESGAGVNITNAMVYTPHLRKVVQAGEYINRLYATATTSGVPFPAGTEIKVYAR